MLFHVRPFSIVYGNRTFLISVFRCGAKCCGGGGIFRVGAARWLCTQLLTDVTWALAGRTGFWETRDGISAICN